MSNIVPFRRPAMPHINVSIGYGVDRELFGAVIGDAVRRALIDATEDAMESGDTRAVDLWEQDDRLIPQEPDE